MILGCCNEGPRTPQESSPFKLLQVGTSGTHAQDHTLNVSNQNMGGIKSSREEEEEEEQEEEHGEGEEDRG